MLSGGAYNNRTDPYAILGPSNQTWVLDWRNMSWAQVGDMHYQRDSPQCTNLPDGKVIVTGMVTNAARETI